MAGQPPSYPTFAFLPSPWTVPNPATTSSASVSNETVSPRFPSSTACPIPYPFILAPNFSFPPPPINLLSVPPPPLYSYSAPPPPTDAPPLPPPPPPNLGSVTDSASAYGGNKQPYQNGSLGVFRSRSRKRPHSPENAGQSRADGCSEGTLDYFSNKDLSAKYSEGAYRERPTRSQFSSPSKRISGRGRNFGFYNRAPRNCQVNKRSDTGRKVRSQHKQEEKRNFFSDLPFADNTPKSYAVVTSCNNTEDPKPPVTDVATERSEGELSDDEADERNDDDMSLGSSDFEDVGSDISLTEEEDDDCAEIPRANYWSQSASAKLYYTRDVTCGLTVHATPRLHALQGEVETKLMKRARQAKLAFAHHDPPPLAHLLHRFKCCHHHDHSNSSSEGGSCCSDSESDEDDHGQRWQLAQEEMSRKQKHPARLDSELWFNEKDQMNDGPVCRCAWKSRDSGIRHNVYPGEGRIEPCDPLSNNLTRLHHYRITISPLRNFKVKPATTIAHDGHDFVFEGFSIFCHRPIAEKLPVCRVVRYNIEYTIKYWHEEAPENFCVQDLTYFWQYLFVDLLELYDLNLRPFGVDDGCPVFHIMPRFARDVEEGGKELLSMSNVLKYLLQNCGPVVSPNPVDSLEISDNKWQIFVQDLRGQLVTNPETRPTTIRVDQLDREVTRQDSRQFPVIVHFGMKPAILTYAGNPEYQKAWKQYVKFRHLLANKPKVTSEDKAKLELKEAYLRRLREKSTMKRDVTVEVSANGFYRTGLYCDVTQHALVLPVLFQHLRFHWCLEVLQRDKLRYTFKSRGLLQLALTHPSYRTNYGMNPDHSRNTMTNCGIRQPEYGDGRIHHMHTRKRGINTLIDIMARMGSKKARKSRITNNERLEFLGDAVIEFLSSVHLFYMFPDLQEGGLATYRSAIVQNRQLASLAKQLNLDAFMLYAHGPDLCHEADLKHAMANCFEAIMASLYLDADLEVADRVFAEALFPPSDETQLLDCWLELPVHPLQAQEPNGDRHWIKEAPALQKLVQLEDATGIQFKHIRILARAFTRRNVGYNFLTLGHNQRLEFLGDTVLQLITSTYLYRHFPEHHEGHLSLLRSCLVNNKTQSVICDDLGLTEYLVSPPSLQAHPKQETQALRMKDRADLVESLIGAIFVDRGLQCCKVFCRVCFFPRLKYFIITQKWNDSKSQLQQCCLTLRSPNGGEPDIPQYKVIAAQGPTNTRTYTVAVYFRRKRLATGNGHSVQEAEMLAADAALRRSRDLFPHLERQRNIIEKRFKSLPAKFYVGQKPRRRAVATEKE